MGRRPSIRFCADCDIVVKTWDLDELALCPDCVDERRRLEAECGGPDPQVGARFVGKQREFERPTVYEVVTGRKPRKAGE